MKTQERLTSRRPLFILLAFYVAGVALLAASCRVPDYQPPWVSTFTWLFSAHGIGTQLALLAVGAVALPFFGLSRLGDDPWRPASLRTRAWALLSIVAFAAHLRSVGPSPKWAQMFC